MAWYKFDETSGTSASDSSGNGKTATLSGSPTWTAGLVGNALNLSGSNQYASLPNGIVSGLTSATICAWVKLDTATSWVRLFDIGTATTSSMFLCPKSGSNTLRFVITTSGTSGEQQINAAVLPTGAWKHVAVTISGGVGILYVDGVEAARNSSMTLTPSSLGSTTKNYIGKSQYTSDPYMDGLVDDFRIYNGALTAAEVQALYSNSRGCIGLVKKQAATGGQVSLSGKVVTGVYSGFFYIQDPEDGHTACGMKVVGTTIPAVGATVSVTGTLTKDANDELVIQASSVSTESTAAAPKVYGTPNRDVCGGTVGIAQGPDDGQGLNMVGVLQATWGKVTSAVVGTSMVVDDGSGAPVKVITSSTAPVGTYVRVTGVSGLDKSSTIHSRVMRTRDSKDVVVPPVVYYKFDETSGTVASDSSGNGRDASLVGEAAWSKGVVNGCVELDGATGYLNVPAGVVDGVADCTISAWVRPDVSQTNAKVFDFGSGSSSHAYLTANSATSKTRFAITTSGDAGEQRIEGPALQPAAWTHVMITLSGATGILYFDGVEVGRNSAMTLKLSDLGVTSSNYIGQSQSAADPLFDGSIDEFIIYSRVWTAAEIQAADRPSPQVAGSLVVNLDARNVGSTAGTWLNQAAGLGNFTKAGNPSVQGVNGVTAMVFDGIDDAFIGPTAPSTLTGASKRSIEIWVYNPSIDSGEETMVAWGKRGTNMADCSFNYGTSSAYGGATHYGSDMGWGGVPSSSKWHYLVYTYDGSSVKLYDNCNLKNSGTFALATATGQTINLAVQNSSSGTPLFLNEFNGSQMAGSMAIAIVRIHTAALTAAQIAQNYAIDALRTGAKKDPTFAERLAAAVTLAADDLTVKLLPDTQTVASLVPTGGTFDFTPGDRLYQRASEGFYNLGDVTMRTRVGTGAWQSFSSAASPFSTTTLTVPNGYGADLTPAFGKACPLKVERRWMNDNGKLVLRYTLINQGTEPVEVGAFGASMVFNNIFTDRTLVNTHEICSFTDPYIGGDAGYVQVTRVKGSGPALIVYPEAHTQFEAYRFLRDDPTGLGVTFEGFYEWMVHSKAYTDNEWAGLQEFNTGTSEVIPAGGSINYGYRFALSPEIKSIESTLLANNRPVAIGVPGYVLTQDQQGRLFVKHSVAIQSVAVEPEGAITVTQDGAPTANGWVGFTLDCNTTGRARMVITYEDGAKQFIHYDIVPSQYEQVRRLAYFHQTKQWYTNLSDPFHRAYSYMLYDREDDKMLDQEGRVFDVGESDEVGAGPNLLMAMKNNYMPDPTQVAQLEQYVDNVLWLNLQTSTYGVKASLFYYDPVAFPNYYTFTSGWLWDKARCDTTWRSYNYPHQAAIYWSLYRLARNYTGLVTHHTWDWYLTQAYKTGLGMRDYGGYNDKGLMDGTVFLEILKDMKREGWTTQLTAYETFFKGRADAWSVESYPFGSEMPWDSTGQEEVYMWCKYYNYPAKSLESLNAVLAYTPTVPNWSYNGAARRYWDSATYGKLPYIFRQSGHYGSSLNAIPVMDSYRDNPADLYLLRVGYGANMNILANINDQGHGSMCFTPDPGFMTWEPYTGDFGSAFFGYAYNNAAYAGYSSEFGWLGFGCDVSQDTGLVTITPRDAFHSKIYIAPLGLWMTLECGTFDHVDYNVSTGAVTVYLSPATPYLSRALLLVSRPGASGQPAYHPTTTLTTERGSYSVPLSTGLTSVTLTP